MTLGQDHIEDSIIELYGDLFEELVGCAESPAVLRALSILVRVIEAKSLITKIATFSEVPAVGEVKGLLGVSELLREAIKTARKDKDES